MGVEGQKPIETPINKETVESVDTKKSMQGAKETDVAIKNTLAIVEKNIKNLENKMQGPKDVFDTNITEKTETIKKEINRIAKENNQEISYVWCIYDLVQKYWDTIDISKINSTWYSSINKWNKWYQENSEIKNSEKILLDLKWNQPILFSWNSFNVTNNNSAKNEEYEKNYSLLSTMPIKISENEFQKQNIEKEIEISKYEDINEEIQSILLNWLYWEGTTIVNWKDNSVVQSTQSESGYKEKEEFTSRNSITTSMIISNMEITPIKSENKEYGKYKIKASIYSPKKQTNE